MLRNPLVRLGAVVLGAAVFCMAGVGARAAENDTGKNLAPNPSFEAHAEGRAEGWDSKGKSSNAEMRVSDGWSHGGEMSLRMESFGAFLDKEGNPRDWVTMAALSDPIPVETGKTYELRVWVYAPAGFTETERGALIAPRHALSSRLVDP